MVTDFLIRVKNAAMARRKEVTLTRGKKVKALALALKKLGFLDEVKDDKVTLTFQNKKAKLMDLKLVSKPGLRIYMGAKEIGKKKGPTTYLLSTPKGILSSREAIKLHLGGEVIAEIL